MGRKIADILYFLFGRVITIYLVLMLIFTLGMKFKEEKLKADIAVLNRLMPTADHFFEFAHSQKAWDKKALRDQINYYRYLVNVIPPREEAYTILGYCYYHLGYPGKAVQYFRKAVSLNSDYFWPQYNLGVIYFQNRQYQVAIQFFKKAISIPLEKTLMVTYSSKITHPFRMSAEPIRYAFDEELMKAYQESTKILIECYKFTSNYTGVLDASMSQIRRKSNDLDFYYFHAGLAAYEMKEYDQAILFLQESIKRNANYADAFHVLGLTLRDMGKSQMSEQILRRETVIRKLTERQKNKEDQAAIRIF